MCGILQYMSHVVAQSTMERDASHVAGGQVEVNFLHARMVLDLLIEICAAPDQPFVKDIAKFIAGIVSHTPACCTGDRMALPLYWIGKQIISDCSGILAALGRKVVKATAIDSSTDADVNLPQFQALKMRMMTRRAILNGRRLKNKTSTQVKKTSSATTTPVTESPSKTTFSKHSGVNATENQNNETTAADTLAKSRAMLAKMKRALGKSKDKTSRAALQGTDMNTKTCD